MTRFLLTILLLTFVASPALAASSDDFVMAPMPQRTGAAPVTPKAPARTQQQQVRPAPAVPSAPPQVIMQTPVDWDKLYKQTCFEVGFVRTPNVSMLTREKYCGCVFSKMQNGPIWGVVSDYDLSRGLSVFRGKVAERRPSAEDIASGKVVANPRNIQSEPFAQSMADLATTSVAIMANQPYVFSCMGSGEARQ